MKKFIALMLIGSLLMCSTALADTTSVTVTKRSAKEGYTFTKDWTKTVEFAGVSSWTGIELAGYVTLSYDDGWISDKDKMYIPKLNGMATGQTGRVCVLNNGSSSGYSKEVAYGTKSETVSVKHTSDSVTYKAYFEYSD